MRIIFLNSTSHSRELLVEVVLLDACRTAGLRPELDGVGDHVEHDDPRPERRHDDQRDGERRQRSRRAQPPPAREPARQSALYARARALPARGRALRLPAVPVHRERPAAGTGGAARQVAPDLDGAENDEERGERDGRHERRRVDADQRRRGRGGHGGERGAAGGATVETAALGRALLRGGVERREARRVYLHRRVADVEVDLERRAPVAWRRGSIFRELSQTSVRLRETRLQEITRYVL